MCKPVICFAGGSSDVVLLLYVGYAYIGWASVLWEILNLFFSSIFSWDILLFKFIALMSLSYPVSGKRRLTTSDNLLISIQEKIKWADSMGEVDKKHKKEVEERVEEAKKLLSTKVRIWVLLS